MRHIPWAFLAGLASMLWAVSPLSAQSIEYVIHVSVDGLRPDAVTTQTPAQLPNFYRLRNEGAFTDNARCDVDFMKTLQNHIDMMTGRGVYGPIGASHEWDVNAWTPGDTLESNKGSYIAGVYGVAHDNGLRTGLYTGKEKFGVFDESWNAINGAPDVTGPDNGRDKLDQYVCNENTLMLTLTWSAQNTSTPQNYSFLHLSDPDWVGHEFGWMSEEYLDSVRDVDGYLGFVFDLAENNLVMAGKTAIIVTADHGGHDFTHGDLIPEDFTVPLMVWGPGVPAGDDLYAMNPTSRQDPGTVMPTWTATTQPIRNSDTPNLALSLLGLGPIPGSAINDAQDLNVFPSIPGDANYDGVVNETDARVLGSHWRDTPGSAVWSHGDFNGDRTVNAADASIMAANWGQGTTETDTIAVPEPNTMTFLVSISLLGLFASRRPSIFWRRQLPR